MYMYLVLQHVYFEWGGVTYISYIQHIKKIPYIVYKSYSRMINVKASTFEHDIMTLGS
jgi:hypothetical protein